MRGDDLNVVTPDPDRLQVLYGTVQRELWVHTRILMYEGMTQVWNSGSVRPGFCDTLESDRSRGVGVARFQIAN